MPNWTFLMLHFAQTLALGVWLGGSLVLASLALPLLRAHLPGRDYGRLAADLGARFDRVVLVCAAVLMLSSGLLIVLFDRMSPWYAIQYLCIVAMSASALFSAVVTAPRRRRLVKDSPTDDARLVGLERAASHAHHFNLACAFVALFFS